MNKYLNTKAFKEIKSLAIVIVSSLIYCIGVAWFLEGGEEPLYAGGIPGIAQLLVRFGLNIDIRLNLGLLVLILNVPLIILGLKGLSIKFIIYSLISILIQTIFLGVIPKVDLKLDNLTNAIIGGMLVGVGTAFALRFGTSTGGLDILCQYVYFKKGISVGILGLIINLLITLISGIFGWEIAIYTAIRLVISTIFIDKIHTAYNFLNVEIITDHEHYEEISKEVLEKIYRGMTMIKAEGAYSHSERIMLYCIISSYERIALIDLVRRIHPQAFIVIKPVKKVYGNFAKKLVQ